MDNNFINVILLAVMSEGIVTYLTQIFIENQFCFKAFLSIVVSVVIAIAYKIDFPQYLNLSCSIPYIGYVLTGLLIARGSNYIYDLLKNIVSIK